MEVIGRARNGFRDKFGVPRQPREESAIETRIVFEPKYRQEEALRGIDGFSHLWILWVFDRAIPHTNNPINNPKDPVKYNNETGGKSNPENNPEGAAKNHEIERENGDGGTFRATVRPPRLGGNTRVGVFATRSPFRPNPIGLSCVKLLRVEKTTNEGTVLVVSGADMVDGTPIVDIKPYIPYTDARPDAKEGFTEATKDYRLEVVWSGETGSDNGLVSAKSNGNKIHGKVMTEVERKAITEILSQDPRPAYQDDPAREYGLDYAGWNIRFRVEGERLIVVQVRAT